MVQNTTRRVLMLHGYGENALMFSKKMAALRRACRDIEFVFVDAPFVLIPATARDHLTTWPEVEKVEGEEEEDDEDVDPSMQPRGWWLVDHNVRKNPKGIERSFEYLRDILKKDHFDGIFGFSQGAAMAVMVTALLERPGVYPPFLVDGKPPHPPFDFCIECSGWKPMWAYTKELFEPSLSTRSLHILGRNDCLIIEEQASLLLNSCSNKRIEYHEGGHFIPRKNKWWHFFADFMHDPSDRCLVSPGPKYYNDFGLRTPPSTALIDD